MGRPKKSNRLEILSKAIPIFWKKGFADTSLQDLEKATNANKSRLYSEFKDKCDLFLQSLEHYSEQSGVRELLTQEPLGRENLIQFLVQSPKCQQQKGCFLINTMRELSILPKGAETFLKGQISQLKKLLVQNIVATQADGDPEMIADLILSYHAGTTLKLNLEATSDLEKQGRLFLDKILGPKSK